MADPIENPGDRTDGAVMFDYVRARNTATGDHKSPRGMSTDRKIVLAVIGLDEDDEAALRDAVLFGEPE